MRKNKSAPTKDSPEKDLLTSGAEAPMTHKDILDFQTRFGLTVTKTCQILGINRIKYMAMVKPDRLQDLIRDPSVEILLRVYYDQPQLLLSDAPPNMIQLFNSVKENEPGALEKDWQFSVVFGRHMGQTYNWMKDKTVNPKVARLVDVITNLKKMGVKKPFTYIRSVAEKTAKARHVTPFSNGMWTMRDAADAEDQDDDD